MNKITGNEPAMPQNMHIGMQGLTIRQHYVGLAMQGMLSACRGYDNKGLDNLANCAVQQADAIIEALNKTTE